MTRLILIGGLTLLGAAPLTAQAVPATPATPAVPATPADPAAGTAAVPATPAIPATPAEREALQAPGATVAADAQVKAEAKADPLAPKASANGTVKAKKKPR